MARASISRQRCGKKTRPSPASVSADGKVFAIAATRGCVGAETFCTRAEFFSTTVTAASQDRDFPGLLQVSANGACAFGPGSNYLANGGELHRIHPARRRRRVGQQPADVRRLRPFVVRRRSHSAVLVQSRQPPATDRKSVV